MRIAPAPIFSAPQAVLRTAVQLLLLAAVLVATACGQSFIPNTDVQDSAENRHIIEFCEEYRRAVERRNVALLFSLAHPSYYEDGGNIDASDDIDYAGLREFLDSKFKEARAIRYEVQHFATEMAQDLRELSLLPALSMATLQMICGLVVNTMLNAASDFLDLPRDQPRVEQELVENFVLQLRVIFLGATQWRESSPS
jgi:hypothetical protein